MPSELQDTIIELAEQGFFLTAFKKKFIDSSGVIRENTPIFRKDTRGGFPTAHEVRHRALAAGEWQRIFKHKMWQDAAKIAVVCGGNGVVGFDFDAKKFNPAIQNVEKDSAEEFILQEQGERALKIWTDFKERLDFLNVQYYCEKTKNAGEHIIFLTENGVDINFSTSNLCGILFGVNFLEVFGKRNGKTSHTLTIAPSIGYDKKSKLNIHELTRIDNAKFQKVMAFFDDFRVKEKEEKKDADAVKSKIVQEVYVSDTNTYVKVLCSDGKARVFSILDFSGKSIDEIGMKHFSVEYMSASSSYSPLKRIIRKGVSEAPKKQLHATAGWYENDFCYLKNSENYFLEKSWVTEDAEELDFGAMDLNFRFEGWKKSVFDECIEYSGASLAILMAFAAPFCEILHQNFAVNFVGDTNIGKTMGLRIARGMYDDPDSLSSWMGTKAALELKKLHSASGILCLDEMFHAEESSLQSIMQLCGVTERERCTYSSGKLNLAESTAVSALILSTSESSFVDYARHKKIKITKGQLNRFLDLNVTKEDFPDHEVLTGIKRCLKNYAGIPMLWLASKMKDRQYYINAFFKRYKGVSFSGMSAGNVRVKSHFMFLEFIAEELEQLGLTGLKKQLEIVEKRLIADVKESLEDKSVLETQEIIDFLQQAMYSSKYTCINNVAARLGEHCCFFTQPAGYTSDMGDIYCLRAKLLKILTDTFPYGKKKISKILNEIKIFDTRTRKKIEPMGVYCEVFKISDAFIQSSVED